VILILLLIVAVVYKLAPNVDQPFRYVTPGSVTAVTIWVLASAGFAAYVERFGNYGATYGSLGGMIVLILYFYISGAVLLFGAEINETIHPAVAQPTGEAARAAPAPELAVSPAGRAPA
jgi:membrane protein